MSWRMGKVGWDDRWIVKIEDELGKLEELVGELGKLDVLNDELNELLSWRMGWLHWMIWRVSC